MLALVLAVSTVELALRMILALAILVVVLLGAGRLARKRLGGAGRMPEIEIAARRQLTKTSTLAVVRAGQRHVLIGVNDHAITVLAEGQDLLADDDGVESEPGSEPVVDIRTPEQQATAGDGRRREARRPGPTIRSAGPRSSVVEALRDLTVRRG